MGERRAPVLALALLILVQSFALTLGGAGFDFHTALCEPSVVQSAGADAPAPAPEARHDCAACLVCAFNSVIAAPPPAVFLPTAVETKVATRPESADAPVVRWRRGRHARAPPFFS